ncbi:hypothetical protein Tco_0486962 [Tanacetum coccineum]
MQAWDKFLEIKHGQSEEVQEFLNKLVEDVQNINEELAEYTNTPNTCDLPVNDEPSPISTTFSNPLFGLNDDFTSSDDESLSDEDVPMENFKIYSNPLFNDEEIIPTKIDQHSFNAESNLIESLLNRDTLIDYSPKFDYLLEEFSGELAHIDSISPGIEKADSDLEEEIRFVGNLLYDNSSLRLPEERNSEIADSMIESLPAFPIPIEDSDPVQEEIDIFLVSDDLIPPSVENDDSEDEDNSTFLPKNESSILEPSSPHPPPKPPDVCLNFKPDTAVINNFDELNEDEYFDPDVEDDDSFTFVIRTFLPYFTYPVESPLFFSTKNEDTVFYPGISAFHFSLPFALPKDE